MKSGADGEGKMDAAPTLSARFDIDAGNAYDELDHFDASVDSSAANAVEKMAKIEKAVDGLSFGGAAAVVRQFGIDLDKAGAQGQRAFDSLIRKAEGAIASNLRFADTVGKTRVELKALEQAATAAKLDGITGTGAEKAQELAAALRASRVAADDAAAATKALAIENAAFARNAAAGPILFERAAKEAAAAANELAAARERAFNRNAAAGPALFERAAQASREAAAAAEQDAKAVERLKAILDPAAASQDRLNKEIVEAKRVMTAAGASAEDLAKVEQLLAERAGVAATAQRFTAAETLNLSRQFQDIGVTAAMGMNPLMILVQQGPQIYDVLEQAKARGVGAAEAFAQMGKDITGGAIAGLGRLAPLLTAGNLLLAGTAAAAAVAVKALGSYGAALDRFEMTAAGVGRVSGETAAQLEAISEAASSSGQRSIGAARDSVNAFAAAGIQGEQTITSLASIVDKYAKLTGQDAPAAQAALASAMKDPAAAADAFTQQLGLLTGAQYEHIQRLAAQGDQEKATSELTKILTDDINANSHAATGVTHVMDALGQAVSGVATMFGRLDQRIKAAGASYDAWLKQHAGGWAVDLFGTGNQATAAPNPNASRNQDQVAALNASQSMNTTGMQQINDLLAKQNILQKGLADTTGLSAAQVRQLRHDYAATTDTLNANRNATGGWITTQERAHLIGQAQTALSAAHTKAERAAAQQTITRLQLGTQVLTQQERQTQAQDAYNRVADKAVRPKVDRHAEELAREAAATEAQIKNLYGLAAAYEASGAQALIAEARLKAESAAIKKQADIEEMVARQVRLAVAQRVADAGKNIATMRDQAMIQDQVNAAVAAGTAPAERAADLLRDRLADLPLLAAAEAAARVKDTAGAEKALDALDKQRAARDRLTESEAEGRRLAAMAAGDNQLAELREEMRLVGETDRVRTHALATLRAEQTAKAQNWSGKKALDYVKQQEDIADATSDLKQMNDELDRQQRLWGDIASRAQDAASNMRDAFGEVGGAIGDVTKVLADYGDKQAQINAERRKAGTDQHKLDELNRQSAHNQLNSMIGLTDAAKGLFKEHSAGYKAMEAAEKALTVVQLVRTATEVAGSITRMFQSSAETAVKVANAGVQATADGAAGVAAQSKLPFPGNLAAMAATAAALVAFGVSMLGGHGTSTADYTKGNTGTGTVLGDTDAKSASIKNAIDALKDIDDKTLTASQGMLASLRSIDTNIAGLSSVLVRSGAVDSAASGVATGFKTDAIGSVLKNIPLLGGFLSGLFGSKTTVVGSGIYGGPQSVGSILDDGFDGQTYADIQKKKKFFGITTSTKLSTQYSSLDDTVGQQFTLILKGFDDAIAAAAGPLGVSTDAVTDKLDSFVLNIGKVDLSGLSGTEIQEKLEAVFGAAGDDMAKAAIPGLDKFQKVGEGYLETLVRVSSTVEAVDASFAKLGLSAHGMGVEVDMAVAGLFDSVSDYTSAANSFFSDFYTKAEQASAETEQLGKVFGSLGLAMPDTLEAFRKLVEAQDLTTVAGQKAYATLLQIAPAFSDLKTSLEGAKAAADILSEREDLQSQLLNLQGDTAAIRAAALAKLDVSNRALQEQVWATQDAQDAAKAAATLADAWKSVGDSILDEINRIRGLTDTTGDKSFASLLGQFNAANVAARSGDQDAAKTLPTLSKSLLDAAGLAATSRQELDRVQAETAAALQATYGIIGQFSTEATSADPTTAAIQAGTAAQTTAATTQASAIDALRAQVAALTAEVAGMRADNNSGHAATASGVNRSAKTLETVAGAGGGTALAVLVEAA